MRKSTLKLVRQLRSRRSYTMKELAIALQVHRRTVQAWRLSGLKPIDDSDRPLLFMGSTVKEFLLCRWRSAKQPLNPDQFYCPRCRKAVTSDPSAITVIDTGRQMGGGESSLHIHGICVECGCQLHRFSTRSRLFSAWLTLINTPAQGTRLGCGDNRVNSTNKQD